MRRLSGNNFPWNAFGCHIVVHGFHGRVVKCRIKVTGELCVHGGVGVGELFALRVVSPEALQSGTLKVGCFFIRWGGVGAEYASQALPKNHVYWNALPSRCFPLKQPWRKPPRRCPSRPY